MRIEWNAWGQFLVISDQVPVIWSGRIPQFWPFFSDFLAKIVWDILSVKSCLKKIWVHASIRHKKKSIFFIFSKLQATFSKSYFFGVWIEFPYQNIMFFEKIKNKKNHDFQWFRKNRIYLFRKKSILPQITMDNTHFFLKNLQ